MINDDIWEKHFIKLDLFRLDGIDEELYSNLQVNSPFIADKD